MIHHVKFGHCNLIASQPCWIMPRAVSIAIQPTWSFPLRSMIPSVGGSFRTFGFSDLRHSCRPLRQSRTQVIRSWATRLSPTVTMISCQHTIFSLNVYICVCVYAGYSHCYFNLHFYFTLVYALVLFRERHIIGQFSLVFILQWYIVKTTAQCWSIEGLRNFS